MTLLWNWKFESPSLSSMSELVSSESLFSSSTISLPMLWRNFHCLLELIYVWLVRPAGFSWTAGYQLFFILLLIRSLLVIYLVMGCWVPCISEVVALLVFTDLLIIVFIFSCSCCPFEKMPLLLVLAGLPLESWFTCPRYGGSFNVSWACDNHLLWNSSEDRS